MEGEGEAHSPPAELEAEHSLADPTYDQGDVSHDQGDVSAVEEIPAEVPSGEASGMRNVTTHVCARD